MAQPRRPPRTLTTNYVKTGDSDPHDDQDQHKSLLQSLMTMGFSQVRAEKAIAVTGSFKEDRLGDCVNWLLAHANDSNIENCRSQEYILYLCPSSGPLRDMIERFWADTRSAAHNGAHESFPHIRLTTFFKVDDGLMGNLVKMIQAVINRSENIQTSYELEYQSLHETAYKYVGLFVSDNDDIKLHDLVEELAAEADKIGIKLDPYTRHMHMSLAYRFPDEQLKTIEELASRIDVNAKCNWELRVYSRDVRTTAHELREVTHQYKSQQSDEISLSVGDVVYTEPDSIQNSVDGWYTGFSLTNGVIGTFPGNYTQKTSAEFKIWTLIKSIVIPKRPVPANPGLYVNIPLSDRSNSVDSSDHNTQGEGDREFSLLFIRHAERVDAVMGKDWVKTCYENNGAEKCLKRFNLNMPDVYIKRRNILDFERDPPITEIGKLQSQLIGRALSTSPLRVKAVYSSPSLRCVETTYNIISQYPEDRRPLIRLENCLFEWNRWHTVLPTFLSPDEYAAQGYHVDTKYKSEMLAFDMMESVEAYYERSYHFAQNIIDKHSRGGGCVILVGHAATAEASLRKLSKRSVPAQREFVARINKVPFCEPIQAKKIDGKWQAVSPPIPKLWHSANNKFDVNLLNT